MNRKWFLAAAIASMAMLLAPALAGCRSAVKPTTVISDYQTSYAVTSKNGLQLTLSISSIVGQKTTVYKSGDAINIFIDEKNMKTTSNNIPADDQWAAQDLILGNNGTGDYYKYPFGVSILQGYYEVSDTISIHPLPCFAVPGELYFGPSRPIITGYKFQLSSDNATIEIENPPNPQWISLALTYAVSTSGYWNGVYPNAILNSFAPGVYTVVGGDEWGALAVLHFTVS